MRRARRAARTVKRGVEMLDRLRQPDAIDLLKEAVRNEMPPVSAVSSLLLNEFGPGVKEYPVRKVLGLCVRAVLNDEGYQVAQSGVRLHDDPVFSTGSTYEKMPDQPEDAVAEDDDDDLVELLVKVATRLGDGQRRRIVAQLETSLG